MSFTKRLAQPALLLAGIFSLASEASTSDNTPSVKFGQGELVTPAAARTYYAGVSNPGSTSSPIDASEPEITAMAAALNNDANLIFEYVHDKVAFVPLYGLQKGGLGALLDKSGNAFDQAQLLVEMLRAAGHTASYVMGDMTVTAAEFKNWFGVDNAVVACRLLADGGIPATISGANSTCGGLSGALNSNVTLSHVWVTATVNGQTKLYDPSFKQHDILSPILTNLKSEMGYSTGAMLTTAGGSTSGNTAHSFNTTAINNSLNGLSSTLITKMNNANNYDESLDTLLGAEIIKPLQTLQDAGTFSGVDGGYVSNTTVSEIPNSYRTLVELGFSVIDQSGTSHVEFYGDQLYGRRLAFDWKANDSSVDNPSLAGGRLTLDDQFVATINTRVVHDPNGQITSNAGYKISNGNASEVKFTVNHAYASNGGAYMDREYQRAVGGFSQSVTFVFGFGGSSDALQSKLTSEHYRDTHHTDPNTICDTQGVVTQNLDTVSLREIKLIDHLKTQVGYGWLSQFSRAVDLQARSVDAVAQHHHSFGMAYTSASWADACETAQDPANAPRIYSMTDSAIQIDMLSGLSVNHRDGSATERRATAQAMALAGATLEGSVFEQYAGKAHTASTAERFEWFNANAASGQAFRIVDDSDWETVQNSLPTAEKLSGYAWHQRYTSAGYIIIAPQGSELGPGAFGGSFPDFSRPSFERGSAFIAVKPDGSDVAHIVFTGFDGAKGGGAQQEDEEDGAFDPSKIADILKDQFEDRSKLHGVDLASGQVSYSPPADVTTGAGEFPYSLAFQRSYNTSGSRARGMGVGWTHNWDINASASGSATEAMGATRAVRSVPSLVAFTVMQDIFAGRSSNFAKDSDTLKRMVAATMVAHWWREHLQNNVVTVQQGANGIQFFKLPGEVFDGPTGSNAELEYVGSGRRTLNFGALDRCPEIQQNIDEGVCREQYYYVGVKYRYTSAEGDTILFNAGKDALGSTNGNIPQFLPDTWDFPTGVKIKFTHNSVGQVTKVQSNLGGNTGTFDGPALTFTWGNETIQSVTGTGLGSVQFTYASGGNEEGTESGTSTQGYIPVTQKNDLVLSGVTDLVGNTTTYSYMGNGLNAANVPANAMNDWLPRLYEVITPDSNLPKMRFAYDSQWRAQSMDDEVRIKNGSSARNAWQFFIAPGHRGERVDTAGNSYTVHYDQYGRAVRTVDELGHAYFASYDGLDRVKRRVMPEGDATEFDYDPQSNVIDMRRFAKTGGTPLMAHADYDDPNWPTKPTAVFDFVQMQKPVNDREATTVTYSATTGLPVSASVPADADGVRGTYSYAYNGFGQLIRSIDVHDRVTVNDYDADGFMTATQVNCGSLGAVSTSQCATSNPTARPKTTFVYDAAGNQVQTDGPLTLAEASDGKADAVTSFYDALRRPVYEVQGYVNAGTPQSNLISALSGVESYKNTQYDAIGRPELVTTYGQNLNPQSVATSYVDDSGNVCSAGGEACSVVSPDGAMTKTVFDPLDRVDTSISVMPSREGGDRVGKTEYDALGRPVVVYQAYGSGNEIKYQRYSYSDNGQVLTVADANGNTTSYQYDGFDRLYRTCFPDETWLRPENDKDAVGTSNCSDYEEYHYDDNGNQIAKRTRRGDWILSTYDALNRIIEKKVFDVADSATTTTNYIASSHSLSGSSYQRESTVTYSYYLDGRDHTIVQTGSSSTVGVHIPNVTLTYGYDSAGRQTSETITYAGRSRTVATTLDSAGNRTSLTYPAANGSLEAGSSKTITFNYDHLGRMTSVNEGSTVLAGYGYDGFSRRTHSILFDGDGNPSNQLTTSYEYANDNALTTLEHDFVDVQNMAHDVVYDFTYNTVNQVTERSISNTLYVHDDITDERRGYARNGLNQYTSICDNDGTGECLTNTSDPITYDDNGNLITYDGWTYTYDAENRMVGATKGSLSVTYEYDPKGRRFATVSSLNGRKEYLYEGDEPIADYKIISGTEYLLMRYLHGASVDERLMYWKYNDTTGAETEAHYYLTNHQGSVVATADASTGIQSAKFTYDAYGNIGMNQATGQPFRYTGRRYDEETGLYYYRARYYHPGMGRFMQTDPIGYEDNMNMYGYVGNDPVNGTDPTGEVGLFGFVVGVALEVGRQALTGEIKDTSLSGIAKNVGKAVVSGLAGATGAGLGAKFAQLGSVAARVGANAVGGAAVNTIAGAANDAIDGREQSAEGRLVDAGIGAVAGGAGALIGEGIDAAKNFLTPVVRTDVPAHTQVLAMQIRNTTQSGSRTSIQPNTVGASDAAANVVANTTGVVESCGADRDC